MTATAIKERPILFSSEMVRAIPDWRESLLCNAFFVGVGLVAVVILWVTIAIWGLLFGDR